MSSSRRTQKRAYASLAFATMLLLGQLLGLAHLALVRHAVCAEHGEVVEVTAKDEGRSVASTVEGAPQEARFIAQKRAGDGHDHCLIALLRRERSAASADLTFTAAPRLTLSLLPPAAQNAASPPIRLLLLAPKNSPPA